MFWEDWFTFACSHKTLDKIPLDFLDNLYFAAQSKEARWIKTCSNDGFNPLAAHV